MLVQSDTKQLKSGFSLPILPGGTYVSNATSFRLHTQTICIDICLHVYLKIPPPPLRFFACSGFEAGELSVC